MREEFSLFPQRPKSAAPDPLTRLGASAMGTAGASRRFVRTLLGAVEAQLVGGSAARAVCRRVAVRQVFFTGFEALPLVSVIAIFVGATLVFQMHLLGGKLHGELVGQIVVAIILRELAPLLTAIIVAGRSGTAIATELGNMRAGNEILGLASLGLDPLRFVVAPRLFGTIVSVLVLTVYFGAIATLSGYGFSVLIGSSNLSMLRSGVGDALVPADLPLFVIKGLGLGTLIGWVCCYFGLEVRASPTEVPRKASQAVMMSLLVCVVYNALVTGGFYWLVTAPVE
jgi:phospholipid/cholesterol/gamma-HCH transport system permease protein